MNIRIRAFHKEERKMYQLVREIHIGENGKPQWVKITDTKLIPAETVILMFSTGQHDVDGQEIFTGDVLQYDSKDLHFLGKVVFSVKDGAFVLTGDDGLIRLHHSDTNKRRIIGNIYENSFIGISEK